MIGLTGTATENISSHGSVSIRGELWRATCARGIIVKGEDVRVVALGEGLTLVVERVTK
jgi:membrane-bound ClpP family serine protease